jgi:hypothetical protein
MIGVQIMSGESDRIAILIDERCPDALGANVDA